MTLQSLPGVIPAFNVQSRWRRRLPVGRRDPLLTCRRRAHGSRHSMRACRTTNSRPHLQWRRPGRRRRAGCVELIEEGGKTLGNLVKRRGWRRRWRLRDWLWRGWRLRLWHDEPLASVIPRVDGRARRPPAGRRNPQLTCRRRTHGACHPVRTSCATHSRPIDGAFGRRSGRRGNRSGSGGEKAVVLLECKGSTTKEDCCATHGKDRRVKCHQRGRIDVQRSYIGRTADSDTTPRWLHNNAVKSCQRRRKEAHPHHFCVHQAI